MTRQDGATGSLPSLTLERSSSSSTSNPAHDTKNHGKPKPNKWIQHYHDELSRKPKTALPQVTPYDPEVPIQLYREHRRAKVLVKFRARSEVANTSSSLEELEPSTSVINGPVLQELMKFHGLAQGRVDFLHDIEIVSWWYSYVYMK